MMDFILNNATLIGLLFFFSFFLLMLMWVLHPGNRRKFEECGTIPLKEAHDDTGK